MESKYLTHLNIKYNKKMLRDELLTLNYTQYFTSLNIKDRWLRSTINDTSLFPNIKKLHNLFPESGVVAYKLQSNSYVHMHTDPLTSCAVNIILSDNNGPVVFEDYGKINYECALFNCSLKHAVPAFDNERLLLKYYWQKKSYEKIKLLLADFIKHH